MPKKDEDVRFGHDLAVVQDAAGVDRLLLERQLELSVEQRLLNLEQQVSFLRELRGSAKR